MSENIPNVPGGAVPPKPSEAAKVQPKKETVRINLPPKPTASPTVKLPMLPTGGAPTAGATPGAPPPPPRPAAAPPPPPPTATGAPKPPAPPVPGTAGSRVASAPPPPKPTVAAAPPPPPPAGVKKPAPVGLAISRVDKALAVVAAITSLAALGSVIYLGWFLTNQSAG